MNKILYLVLLITSTVVGDITPLDFLVLMAELAPQEHSKSTPSSEQILLLAQNQLGNENSTSVSHEMTNHVKEHVTTLLAQAEQEYPSLTLRPPTQEEIDELFETVSSCIVGPDILVQVQTLLATAEQNQVDMNQLINAREEEGQITPLMAAIFQCGQQEMSVAIIKELIDRGAHVNSQDKSGWTPLMHIANIGDNEHEGDQSLIIMEMLFTHGANPALTNKLGETALDIAQKHGARTKHLADYLATYL